MLPKHNVSRSCISKLNMTNILNEPLVEAPELPIGQLCVTNRSGSNGTAPGLQNHNKQNDNEGSAAWAKPLNPPRCADTCTPSLACRATFVRSPSFSSFFTVT